MLAGFLLFRARQAVKQFDSSAHGMKYYVQVPLDRPIQFPDVCPFTGRPSPKGTVRLKRSSTSRVVLLPDGFHNSYRTTKFRIPASQTTAAGAMVLEALIWLSILAGAGVCVLLMNKDGRTGSLAVAALVVGLLLALGVRFARYLFLRKVTIKNAWEGFVEVRFLSESYARRLCDLNRLALDAR